MNTMPDPFVPASPPSGAAAPAAPEAARARRSKKGARSSRRAAKPAAPVEAPAPKKARKPRAAKTPKAPRVSSGKLGINEIVSATVGLKEDEARTLLALVGKLDGLSKGSKVKVTAALGKLFS